MLQDEASKLGTIFWDTRYKMCGQNNKATSIEGGVAGNGRRDVGQKRHWEVEGSRILDQDVEGLDFASQLWDVGGFAFKRFSPKQRHQIDTNQAIPSVTRARSD